jgi:hypothetical protein
MGCLTVMGKPLPYGRGSVTWRVDFARFTTLSFCQSEIPKTVKHPFQ